VELILAFVAVLVGAVVQGSVGFGLALVVVPVLALIRPEALPAVVLLLTMPMAALMSAREWRFADVTGLLPVLGGRILGTLGGVGLLTLVPSDFLSVLFGVLVLAAVLASLLRLKVCLDRRTKFSGGVASGVMGTAGGVGGPPLALVYEDRSGPEIRSTLAVAFVVSTGLSLIALFLSGRVGAEHALLTLQLLPGILLGLFSTRWVAPMLDASWLRPAILVFAAASGLAAVILGLAR
jgi:uncharacterized membrane protein YfcA